MNLNPMQRRHIFPFLLLLGTLRAEFAGAQTDSDALFRQARGKIVENTGKLPKYTCVQTIRRSRFDSFYGARRKGCGERQNVWLTWKDQLKLDVTIAEGAEIFSWAGAREFQSPDAQIIAGNGLTSTGDFGHFLMTIFGSDDPPAHQYLGLDRDHGQTLAVYQYRVPRPASRYEIKLSSKPGDAAALAYEGKFWIDPQNAELRRMTIAVPQTPPRSETCRIETSIDYHRVPIGGSQLLLPQLTLLKLWDSDGSRYENRSTYGACRAFQSESVLRTDLDPGTATTAADSAAESPFSIPPRISVRIALLSQIDGETAFAGDAIEGRITEPLRFRDCRVLGRIVRLEQNLLPSRYFTVGLKFDVLRANGQDHPLHLEVVTQPRNNHILAGGLFIFTTDQLILDQGFVSEWTTK
jgi:hypothetical protein